MPQNPNAECFERGKFHNKPTFSKLQKGLSRLGLIRKLIFQPTPGAIPKAPVPVQPIAASSLEAQRQNDEIHLYRLGHSTILMKLGAEYWLTDPVFSNRASPVQWAGPKRFHLPPISIADLPKLAGVLISHNHYDHLDISTIKQLTSKAEHFITPRGIGNYLTRWGVPQNRITELGWWQTTQHGPTKITTTPSQHFSGRGLFDENKSLWASFAIQHTGKSIFYGSDSGYFEGFKQINAMLGKFDLNLLECGAYSTAWPDVHMTPEQTLKAHNDLGGGMLMPIHNSTFKLSFHPWEEPLERIYTLASKANIPLTTPEIGARVVLGQPHQTRPWWREVP